MPYIELIGLLCLFSCQIVIRPTNFHCSDIVTLHISLFINLSPTNLNIYNLSKIH